jgi:hypothetical protein
MDWIGSAFSGNCGDAFQRKLEYQAAVIGNCSSNSEKQTTDGLFLSLWPNFESGRLRQLNTELLGLAVTIWKAKTKT